MTVLFQQGLRGNEGVEESVALNAAFEVAEVDENGANEHVGPDVKTLHFTAHLFFDFASDFVLTLIQFHAHKGKMEMWKMIEEAA